MLLALISIALNPLVFRNNISKKRSIARDLYLTLSTTDFLTSVFLSTTYSVGILRPKEEQCYEQRSTSHCDTRYHEYIRKATISEKVVGSISLYLIFSPFSITSVLAISRWYQISFPFRDLHKSAVEVFLAVLCLLQASHFSLMLFTDTNDDPTIIKVSTQVVWNDKPYRSAEYLPKIEGYLVIFLCCLSTVASGITIRNILRSNTVAVNLDVHERKIRSTVKITLLNIGNLVYISGVLAYVFSDPQSHDTLILESFLMFVPIVQSTYNPVIYTALTRDFFKKNARVRGEN
jgi:hypothetical protein